jgi:anthranilate synthase/aminodeoxychorismate synthase-like glutamine amidotransferase
MILLLDNYDSFVHNLARYVSELGFEAQVVRCDALSIVDIEQLGPTHIIISPGPCSPAEAGISCEVVRRFGHTIPVFGVCLGHQCIGAAYGGAIARALRPVHGKTSRIHHEGFGIFKGLPSPFLAARYHSLIVTRDSLPASLRVLAWSDDGEIMALEHKTNPAIGVQFHPESAATEYGYVLLARFLTGGVDAPIEEWPNRADGIKDINDGATDMKSPWSFGSAGAGFPAALPTELLLR